MGLKCVPFPSVTPPDTASYRENCFRNFPASSLCRLPGVRCPTIMDDVATYTKYLGESVLVQIDRPKGSQHPRLGFTYETNYGFVPGTLAGDGHEIDAWVLNQQLPLSEFKGKCVAVIVRKDDDENKLIVADSKISRDQIISETKFVEGYYDIDIILEGDDYTNAGGT